MLGRRQDNVKSTCRVLIIGMADSIHLARWLSQFEETNIEFRLVSSSPHRRLHRYISDSLDTPNGRMCLSMSIISRFFSLPLWILDRFFSNFFRGLLIAIEIRRFRPSFLHVNEIQNAGYATLRAIKILKYRDLPPIFVTNYGSELIWFGQFPKHRRKMEDLLKHSAAFSAECRRDYLLAENFGFVGLNMPQMPVAGGARYSPNWSGSRRTIAIKGYHNKWGRALTVLECVGEMQEDLRTFDIEVFSSNFVVKRKVKKLSRTTDLNIVCYGKGSLSHEQMMELFSRSICYIGFSLSDGISTSMIESMANGAIPIQTSTSCADEWLENGRTGFIISPNDTEGLKLALKQIVSGEFNRKEAQIKNFEIIQEKYDPDMLRDVAKSQYQLMLEHH